MNDTELLQRSRLTFCEFATVSAWLHDQQRLADQPLVRAELNKFSDRLNAAIDHLEAAMINATLTSPRPPLG